MLTLYIADVERDAGMKKLSREEAAKVLEGIKVKIEIPKAAVTQWERNAALDMAIEVLNCSEIPNKSDTISRQAALDAIMGQPPEPHYPAWYAAQIEELPVAQPEHKTGRWMFGFNNQYLEKYYYCSNCGCRKYTEDEPSDYFCSKCGADMRGGEME